MILFSQKSEIKVLQTLCDDTTPKNTRFSYLGMLDKSMFHLDPARKTFERIVAIVNASEDFPDWTELVSDLTIDESFREVLEESSFKPSRDKKRYKKVVETLDKYRIVRELYYLSKYIADELDADSINPDELIEDCGIRLGKASKNIANDEVIYTFGKTSNIKNLVKRTLHKPSERLYKTGFTEYDEVNGGLPTKGVFLMAATTSGGKSVMLMNLLKRLHDLNKIDVCKFTFEMSEEQEMNRTLAMLSGIPFSRFKQGKLSDREKKKATQAALEFNRAGKKNGTKFAFLAPNGGMTIEDVLNMARPFNYQVLGIDYVGLLEGVDDENQWRVLSDIVRQCKIFGMATGTLVIVLAQLDDKTDTVRYSKAMREHADVYWHWNYADDEVRALHELPVKIGKVRDGELFELRLPEEFEFMRVGDGASRSERRLETESSGDSSSSKPKTNKYALS